MSSSFGKIFRVSTFGESHGGAVGVILDGCPPKLKIDINLIQNELDRRRPGQSDITTPRNEEDKIEVLSGIKEGLTLGTPIAMMVRNKDQRPRDYDNLEQVFRPSHADGTYQLICTICMRRSKYLLQIIIISWSLILISYQHRYWSSQR